MSGRAAPLAALLALAGCMRSFPRPPVAATRPAKLDARAARSLVVEHYGVLSRQIRSGRGERLGDLFDALGVDSSGRPEALKTLKSLLESYTNVPEFADNVVMAFVAEPAAGAAPMPIATAAPACDLDASLAGPVAGLYDCLASGELEWSMKRTESLSNKVRNSLLEHALVKKGKRSFTSWAFAIEPALPQKEKTFLAWLVGKYSDYRPSGF